MTARGKRERSRARRAWGYIIKISCSPVKGRNSIDVISAFQASLACGTDNQGRRAPLRFALAPG
jgi:hypothetical protein